MVIKTGLVNRLPKLYLNLKELTNLEQHLPDIEIWQQVSTFNQIYTIYYMKGRWLRINNRILSKVIKSKFIISVSFVLINKLWNCKTFNIINKT